MKKFFLFFVCAAVLVGTASSAWAQIKPKLVSQHESWKVFTFADSGEHVCFMSSVPQKQEGKFKKRGTVAFFVTHWSEEKSKNVVSVSNGYAFKPSGTVTATIDGRNFELFTQEETAWTKDQTSDDAMTEALRKGAVLVVMGVSSRGTETTDTYSLKGAGAAYQAMLDACAGKTKSGKKQ